MQCYLIQRRKNKLKTLKHNYYEKYNKHVIQD